MASERLHKSQGQPARKSDWVRSERISTRIALAIALAPIPVALLISWALGSPPWRPRPAPGPDRSWDAPETPDFRPPRPFPPPHREYGAP
jgi:hypothetical protein